MTRVYYNHVQNFQKWINIKKENYGHALIIPILKKITYVFILNHILPNYQWSKNIFQENYIFIIKIWT